MKSRVRCPGTVRTTATGLTGLPELPRRRRRLPQPPLPLVVFVASLLWVIVGIGWEVLGPDVPEPHNTAVIVKGAGETFQALKGGSWSGRRLMEGSWIGTLPEDDSKLLESMWDREEELAAELRGREASKNLRGVAVATAPGDGDQEKR